MQSINFVPGSFISFPLCLYLDSLLCTVADAMKIDICMILGHKVSHTSAEVLIVDSFQLFDPAGAWEEFVH
jgi:hypothetical protein